MAVVDSRLKVFGVQGLRVVDASVMPIIVGMSPLPSFLLSLPFCFREMRINRSCTYLCANTCYR